MFKLFLIFTRLLCIQCSCSAKTSFECGNWLCELLSIKIVHSSHHIKQKTRVNLDDVPDQRFRQLFPSPRWQHDKSEPISHPDRSEDVSPTRAQDPLTPDSMILPDKRTSFAVENLLVPQELYLWHFSESRNSLKPDFTNEVDDSSTYFLKQDR